MARAVATPLRFGPPSLDTRFADKMIVSVPGDRGGWTCAYVEREVFPEVNPAWENVSCRYSVRLLSALFWTI
jgi:hypothetical protein